jgi:hypothetical protein
MVIHRMDTFARKMQSTYWGWSLSLFFLHSWGQQGSILWSQFSANFANLWRKIGVFLWSQCYDASLTQIGSILKKNTQYFCNFFVVNISKIITSVPEQKQFFTSWDCPRGKLAPEGWTFPQGWTSPQGWTFTPTYEKCEMWKNIPWIGENRRKLW